MRVVGFNKKKGIIMDKEYRIKKCAQGYVVTQHHIWHPEFGPENYGTEYGFSTYEEARAFIEAKFFGDKAHDEA